MLLSRYERSLRMGKTSEMGFGIIGLGRGKHGVRAIGNTEEARLVAVCDLQEEKAKKIAEENGCDWTLE